MNINSIKHLRNTQTLFTRSYAHQNQKIDPRNIQKNCEETQRNLLVELKTKWPVEATRDDRSIRHTIIERVEKELKQKDKPEDSFRNGMRANDDLKGAKLLVSDKSFNDFKLKNYLVPDTVSKHSALLTSESQKKIKTRKWGMSDRFLTWILGDYEKYKQKQKELEENKKE
jgi:hypothetical protein